MTSPKKQAKEAAELLEELRKKHGKLAKKMELRSAKLQKKSRRLQKLEEKIARMERQAHALLPDSDGKPTVAIDAATLRPVRLIFNPKSGLLKKSATLEECVEMLRRHGLQAEVTVKTSGSSSMSR